MNALLTRERNVLEAPWAAGFARMRALYDDYARDYGVIPMPDDYDVMKAVTEGAP